MEQVVNADGKGEEGKEKAHADNASDKGGKMIPKERFDQINAQKKEAIEALDSVVKEMVEDIPEEMRDLVPDLPPAQKIAWIRNAQKKGVFGGGQKESGPDSKRPSGKQAVDLSGLSPVELRRMGYKQ